MAQQKKKISFLAVLITVFFLKELAWLVVIPPQEAPDELAHYSYISSFYSRGNLPVLGVTWIPKIVEISSQMNPTLTAEAQSNWRNGTLKIDTPGDQLNWIAQHPPLYYFLLLPLFAVLPANNIFLSILLLRLTSLILGALTLFFAAKTLKNIIPKKPFVQMGVVSALAFLPMFSFMSAVVNNDNLVMFLSVVLFFFLSDWPEKRRQQTRQAIKIGLVLGALALTKITSLPLFPVVALFLAYRYIHQKAERRTLIRSALIMFLLAAVVSGWWYVHNISQYRTPFPELKAVVELHPELLKENPYLANQFPEVMGTAQPKLGVLDFLGKDGFLVQYFKNIWGVFGKSFIRLFDWQYVMIVLFCLVGVIGLCWKRRGKMSGYEWALLWTIIIFSGAISAKLFTIARDRGFLGAMHGRYFSPALLPMFYFLWSGWNRLIPEKKKEWVLKFLIIVFVVSDLATLFYIVMPQLN